MEVCWVWHMAW